MYNILCSSCIHGSCGKELYILKDKSIKNEEFQVSMDTVYFIHKVFNFKKSYNVFINIKEIKLGS